MNERPKIAAIGRRALEAELALGRNVNACTHALRQMDALDAAWKRNEEERGGVVSLARLQAEYCEMADVPLRWAQDDGRGIPW